MVRSTSANQGPLGSAECSSNVWQVGISENRCPEEEGEPISDLAASGGARQAAPSTSTSLRAEPRDPAELAGSIGTSAPTFRYGVNNHEVADGVTGIGAARSTEKTLANSWK